jgi:lipopolysaccharide heptosyltransferase I
VTPLDRRSASGVAECAGRLRRARYTHALDFQSLYKSALLAALSGARERLGFHPSYMREPLAGIFYTRAVLPAGRHKIEHNLKLAEAVGARGSAWRFPLRIPPEAKESAARKLAEQHLEKFYIFSPGGGWRSKCWPPKRYALLHRMLWQRHGWRGVLSHGPGEETLAREVTASSGEPAPVVLEMNLGELMAALERAMFFTGADTGPLHIASALATPVIGLYGPTDPGRNGPWRREDVVVRAAGAATSYAREREYSASMAAITVERVAAAIEKRMGICG